MNAILCRQDKTMCTFSAYIAFNKAIDGQTDIKRHAKRTQLKVTVEDRVEMLPPSQRSSWENNVCMQFMVLSLMHE